MQFFFHRRGNGEVGIRKKACGDVKRKASCALLCHGRLYFESAAAWMHSYLRMKPVVLDNVLSGSSDCMNAESTCISPSAAFGLIKVRK